MKKYLNILFIILSSTIVCNAAQKRTFNQAFDDVYRWNSSDFSQDIQSLDESEALKEAILNTQSLVHSDYEARDTIHEAMPNRIEVLPSQYTLLPTSYPVQQSHISDKQPTAVASEDTLGNYNPMYLAYPAVYDELTAYEFEDHDYNTQEHERDELIDLILQSESSTRNKILEQQPLDTNSNRPVMAPHLSSTSSFYEDQNSSYVESDPVSVPQTYTVPTFSDGNVSGYAFNSGADAQEQDQTEKWPCKECGREFKSEGRLQSHNNRYHSSASQMQFRLKHSDGKIIMRDRKIKETSIVDPLDRNILCKFCSRKFSEQRYLTKHMNIVHRDKVEANKT